MYLLGFWFALWFAKREAAKTDWGSEEVENLLYSSFLALLIGGRLGYVLIYQLQLFLHDPLYLLKIWQGGMSFHGGLLGVCLAMWYFARKSGKSFLTIADFVAPLVPVGLALGRIGNFINGELWGRVTEQPWGVLFPNADSDKRHPSQLYEALLEGGLLFTILLITRRKSPAKGTLTAMFLSFYAIFRFIVEYFREPDPQLTWLPESLSMSLTMGQLLSIPMILAGVWLLIYIHKRPHKGPNKGEKPGNRCRTTSH